MSPDSLIFLFLAVCIALVIWLGYNIVVTEKNRRRLERLNAVKIGSEAKSIAGAGDTPLDRRKIVEAKLKEAEAKRQKKRGYKLREQLIQAGLENIQPWQFNVAALLAALAASLFSFFVFQFNPLLSFTLIPLIFGLGLPKFVLHYMTGSRQKLFISQFADAIDVIVRGVKAGLPVPECIAVIGREMPQPIGPEFQLISEGTRLGMALEECLERAIDRVPIPELRFFAIVLVIQRQTGGNLAETLGKLSDVLRGRKRMRDKVKAMSSEAKASAGIIGSLPVVVGLILSMVAPDYIGLLFTTNAGHIAIGGGLAWMGIGVFVMSQMISFEM